MKKIGLSDLSLQELKSYLQKRYRQTGNLLSLKDLVLTEEDEAIVEKIRASAQISEFDIAILENKIH